MEKKMETTILFRLITDKKMEATAARNMPRHTARIAPYIVVGAVPGSHPSASTLNPKPEDTQPRPQDPTTPTPNPHPRF